MEQHAFQLGYLFCTQCLFLLAQVVTGLVIDTTSTANIREQKAAVISYSGSLVDGSFLQSAYGVGMTMPLTPDYTHWFRVKAALCSTVAGAPAPPAVPAPAPAATPDAVPGMRPILLFRHVSVLFGC
jgi:hypothetical protein